MAFMVHEVQMGKHRTRQSFSHIDEILDMPDLIEVQKNSYQRFLETDLREVLDDVSPIVDYTENLSLEFVDYSLEEPKNSVERCKERDMTYAAPLKVFVRLKNRETGEIKESDVFMGDFPLMTEHGTFIINGAVCVGENCTVNPFISLVNDGVGSAAPTLGDNVFLGIGCKVLGDVCLADGCVVGAGAVVTKSFLEPGTHIAGVPARKIEK